MTFTNAVLESFKKRMHDILNKEPALKKKYQERTMAKIIRLANEAELPASKILNALNGDSPKSSKTVKTSKGTKKTLVRAKVAAKYRNPVDPSLTWTGRSKAPTWCLDLRSKGQLDSALIDPTTQLGQVAVHVGQ
jgi:DNA-binding protein H-NS